MSDKDKENGTRSIPAGAGWWRAGAGTESMGVDAPLPCRSEGFWVGAIACAV